VFDNLDRLSLKIPGECISDFQESSVGRHNGTLVEAGGELQGLIVVLIAFIDQGNDERSIDKSLSQSFSLLLDIDQYFQQSPLALQSLFLLVLTSSWDRHSEPPIENTF
jgi:hypothetical protein